MIKSNKALPAIQPRVGSSFTMCYTSSQFNILDTTFGACFKNDNGLIVFVLIPRNASKNSIGGQSKNDINMMRLHGKTKSNVTRGTSRPSETTGSYPNSGYKANRGGKGFISSNFYALGPSAENGRHCLDTNDADPKKHLLRKLANRCDNLLDEFVPANDLRAISAVRDTIGYASLSGPATRGVYATAAISVDYSSATHIDDDFFFTLLAVRSVSNQELCQPIQLGDCKTDYSLPYKANTEPSPTPCSTLFSQQLV